MEKRRRRPLTKLSVMEFTEFMLQFKRQRGGVGGLDYGQLAKSHFGENFKSKVSLDHTNPMRVFFSIPFLNILNFIAIRPAAAIPPE